MQAMLDTEDRVMAIEIEAISLRMAAADGAAAARGGAVSVAMG